MGIEEVPTAPRSPWQNPYCERVIGSIGRECLNHMIVLSEGHLKRILASYLEYYHRSRPHLSLDRNSPTPREVEPPSQGEVVPIPQVGGLHHRYTRAARTRFLGRTRRHIDLQQDPLLCVSQVVHL
jgi:putative transposase